MSLISITNLTFAYDGSYDTIFDHTSFQIDTDWKLGFIGRNGRGKTTLLNLLMGKYEYRGNISASVQFDYFPYHVKDKSQFTINVVEEICTDYEYWRIAKEMSLLQVDEEVLYRPFETLSNGEQTKVLLAALFLNETHFLLIDEPTNHLDAHGRELVSRYLNQKKGFILISHDRAFLDGCIDHVLSINRANIEVQKGNYASWSVNRERQDAFELAENEKLKKEGKRLQKAAGQKARWSDKIEASKFGEPVPDRGFIGHKSAKMMKRAKTIESRQDAAIQEQKGLLKNVEATDELKMTPLTHHNHRFVSLEQVTIYYGEKKACENVSLALEQGMRVILQGGNGSGKSSILKLICGEEITHTGTIQRASGLVISYVSQDTSFLTGTLTDYAVAQKIEERLFKALLRKLGFSREQFDKDMKDFSGGQKKKVLIARSLCQSAHLYIWDEPLNFIDVISRVQIEKLLLEYKPTILLVEHDKIFCEKIATHMISLEQD